MNYSTDPLIYELRSGKEGDEFVERTINQKIINRKVLLPELPDPNRKVEISGYFELPNESDEIGPNHFFVDYQTGDVFFHPEQEGKSITAHFFGRGLVYIPASRVYTRTQNGNVTETLEKIVEKGEEAVEELKKIDTTIQLAEDATEEAIQAANASNLAAKHATDMGNFASTKGQEAELAAQHADSARLSAERSEQIRITAESERNAKEMVRQQEETSRETKETQRQDKEAGRLTAETERQTAETARASAEALRRSEEDKRKLNETTRQSSETTRNDAESSRQQAEGLRVTDESKRQQNETKRVSYEAARVLSENDRGSRESSRHDAEQIRLLSETERVNEEKKRILAEAGRGAAETGRQTAETNRVSAETMRSGSEKTRVDNEKQRMLDEKSRSESEATRMGSEQERGINETDRNSAELVRKTSEAERIAAEQQRNNNEAARQTSMDNALSNVNHAIQIAEEIVENTKGLGEYDSETTYHPNNIVTYNGSSFMALDEVAGVTPSTSSSKWQLVAQRGIDGAGSVVTVNGKSPDLDGNVLLTVNEVQGAVTAQQLAQVNSSKVDKIAGKNLSTEDYTTADKNKLGGIASGANNYTHPVGDGNLHVPATGTSNSGKVLKAGATAGSAAWSALSKADISDFPASLPANGGDADTLDGMYADVSAGGDTIVARNKAGNVRAAAFYAGATEGTAPFNVASTTVVANLNADMLDGLHADSTASGNTIVAREANGEVFVSRLYSNITSTSPFVVASTYGVKNLNADMVDGFHASTDNSVSRIVVRDNSGMVHAADYQAYHSSGDSVRLGFIDNQARIRVVGNNAPSTSGFEIQTVAERKLFRVADNGQVTNYAVQGVAPLVVTSSTLVSNLNADMLDGLHAADFLRQPQNIATGADLNNYATAGMYSCATNAIAGTLLNSPTSKAFSLLVEKHAGTKQTLTTYDADGSSRTWTRNSYGSWEPWRKVWDERYKGAGSGLDADMLDGKHASEFFQVQDNTTAIKNANMLLSSGSYMTGESFTGSPFAGNDVRNEGYIEHYSWGNHPSFAMQRHLGKEGTVRPRYRLKVGSVWGAWITQFDSGYQGHFSEIDADMVDGFHVEDFIIPYATTGGTATAYNVYFSTGFKKIGGRTVRIRAHAASGASPTLNANGTGAASLRNPDGTPAALTLGGIYTFTWNEFAGAFMLQGERGDMELP